MDLSLANFALDRLGTPISVAGSFGAAPSFGGARPPYEAPRPRR